MTVTTATPQPRQRGAALIVGLVLLMVLTLLGVSGLTTATLELQMAGNTQQAQHAFQAAESAIEAETSITPPVLVLGGGEARGDRLRPQEADNPGIQYDYGADGAPLATARVVTTYQDITQCNSQACQLRVESCSVATSTSRGAQSSQCAGWFILVPP